MTSSSNDKPLRRLILIQMFSHLEVGALFGTHRLCCRCSMRRLREGGCHWRGPVMLSSSTSWAQLTWLNIDSHDRNESNFCNTSKNYSLKYMLLNCWICLLILLVIIFRTLFDNSAEGLRIWEFNVYNGQSFKPDSIRMVFKIHWTTS